MRTIIRNGVAIVILQLLLAVSISAWATSHRYDTGIMESISDKEIVMAEKVYKILPKTKVIFKIKDAKGAYYEHQGRFSDLRVGEKIFLKVTGYDILEVEVLR